MTNLQKAIHAYHLANAHNPSEVKRALKRVQSEVLKEAV